jgi:PhnB protein
MMSERAAPSAKRPDPIPADYRGATPYLCVHDGKGALEFYQRAFGAKETMRMAQPDGRIGHAEFRIGDAVIMLADEFPEMGFRSPKTLGGSPVNLLVYVPDVDAFVKQAEAAGATVQRPPTDQFYGDRMATLTDPYGHGWSIATHVEDVSAEEMERRMKENKGA